MNRKKFISKVEETIQDSQEAIAKFAASLSKDPYHALHWNTTSAMEAVCKLKEYKALLDALNSDRNVSIEMMKEHFNREAKRNQRFPSFSTSPSSNLLHLFRGTVLVEILDALDEVKDE